MFHDVAAPSAQVSLEVIAQRDPDFVAVLSETAAPPAFAARREWRAIRAVRKARFLHLRGSLFGRPGPRALEAVRAFQRLLDSVNLATRFPDRVLLLGDGLPKVARK